MFGDHRKFLETPTMNAYCMQSATKVCLAQYIQNMFCDVNHINIDVTSTAWKRIELLAVSSMYAPKKQFK